MERLPKTALFAFGQKLKFVSFSDESITVRTTLHLCPGRSINCRLGEEPARAVILSSSVCALGTNGAEYLVSMALAPAADAVTVPGTVSTATIAAPGELRC